MDFSNSDKVEELNQKRSLQWLKLYKKMKDAKEIGDEAAFSMAKEAFRKHEATDQKLKRKAEQSGCDWI